MTNITNTKISNKFIPRTHSHTKSRIKHIVNKIKHTNKNTNNTKTIIPNTITNNKFQTTDFKVYKQKYFNTLLETKSQEHITNTNTNTNTNQYNNQSNNQYIIVIPSYNRPSSRTYSKKNPSIIKQT